MSFRIASRSARVESFQEGADLDAREGFLVGVGTAPGLAGGSCFSRAASVSACPFSSGVSWLSWMAASLRGVVSGVIGFARAASQPFSHSFAFLLVLSRR